MKKERLTVTLDKSVITKLRALKNMKSLNVSGFVNKTLVAALDLQQGAANA